MLGVVRRLTGGAYSKVKMQADVAPCGYECRGPRHYIWQAIAMRCPVEQASAVQTALDHKWLQLAANAKCARLQPLLAPQRPRPLSPAAGPSC